MEKKHTELIPDYLKILSARYVFNNGTGCRNVHVDDAEKQGFHRSRPAINKHVIDVQCQNPSIVYLLRNRATNVRSQDVGIMMTSQYGERVATDAKEEFSYCPVSTCLSAEQRRRPFRVGKDATSLAEIFRISQATGSTDNPVSRKSMKTIKCQTEGKIYNYPNQILQDENILTSKQGSHKKVQSISVQVQSDQQPTRSVCIQTEMTARCRSTQTENMQTEAASCLFHKSINNDNVPIKTRRSETCCVHTYQSVNGEMELVATAGKRMERVLTRRPSDDSRICTAVSTDNIVRQVVSYFTQSFKHVFNVMYNSIQRPRYTYI